MSTSTVALDLTGLGVFPLCANQESTLVSRAGHESSQYLPPSLIRFGFRLDGQINVEAVRAALSRFVERHPALRSSFAENILLPREERNRRIAAFNRTGVFEPGVFVQQVHHDVAPAVFTVDCTGLPPAERNDAFLRIIRSEDLRPFNHSDQSRVRALFIRTAADQSLLILVFDHVVFDGYSGSITCGQLEHLLSERSDAAAEPSPTVLPCGFPSFAEWQNRAFRTSYFRSSICFWRDQWARFARYRVSYEDLPFSRPAEQEADHRFATAHASLDESASAAVKAFAGDAKTTLYAVCLAALARVLSEYTGWSSVVVWTHLLNRVQPGTMHAVGFFNNTHILGIELPPSVTGRELVHQVGRVITAALAHQELPLPFLWRTLKCAPMYYDARILMDFRTLAPRAPTNESSPLSIERLALPEPLTPRLSQLGIYVTDHGNTLQLSASFRAARFLESGIKDFLGQLRGALLDLVTDPDAPCRRPSTVDRAPQPGMGEFRLVDSAYIPFP